MPPEIDGRKLTTRDRVRFEGEMRAGGLERVTDIDRVDVYFVGPDEDPIFVLANGDVIERVFYSGPLATQHMAPLLPRNHEIFTAEETPTRS